VYMQEIKLFVLHHTHHLAGQGQLVRRIFKQRVRMEINLVVKKIFIQKIKSRWLRVGNKMNFVSFFSQGFAQFSCHHSTSTESGVAYNSNFNIIHVEISIQFALRTGSSGIYCKIISNISGLFFRYISKNRFVDHVLYPRTYIGV
jgi:hypothetical protein